MGFGGEYCLSSVSGDRAELNTLKIYPTSHLIITAVRLCSWDSGRINPKMFRFPHSEAVKRRFHFANAAVEDLELAIQVGGEGCF
jgi:hypothetical protein